MIEQAKLHGLTGAMKVLNIHERLFDLPAQRVGALIDSLASPQDRLWPQQSWPRMAFDRPLGVGAVGGHGPIRYTVEEYRPGSSVKFRFSAPRGFDGYHGFTVSSANDGKIVLRHTLEMTAHGPAVLSWPLVFRPLHDALLEDTLAQAEVSLGRRPTVVRWSAWVRTLRWFFSRGQARPQRFTEVVAQQHRQ